MEQPLGEKFNPKHIWPAVYSAVFFVLFYLYVWLWVDPSLLYHGVGAVLGSSNLVLFPAFSWSLTFFKSFLLYPGGPVEYLAALLSQFYYYPWAGALIIAAVAALLGWATNSFMTAVTGVRVPIMWFIPGILILVQCHQYTHKLAVLVAVLVAMLAVCVYVRTARCSSPLRFAAFLALAAPLYYIAGGAYLLYAALCAIFELSTKQGPLLRLCYLLFAPLIPYAFGTCVFHLSIADTYARLLPLHASTEWSWVRPAVSHQIAILGLYLFLVLAALGGVLWRRVAGTSKQRYAVSSKPMNHATKSSRRADSPDGNQSISKMKPARLRMFMECFRNLKAKPGVELAFLLVAVAAAGLLSFDSSNRTILRIHRFASQEMWPQVLSEARRLPRDRYTYPLSATVNRALYETGRLPYDMFSYTQHPLNLMLAWGHQAGYEPRELLDKLRLLSFFQLSDLELQLGLIHDAERDARDALGIFGDYPLILKRLALINIAKGQGEAAKVFLRALTRYIHYRVWAQNALRRLQADPLWSTDPQIHHIRSVMVMRESAVSFGFSLENRFDELLRRNRHNRMAFEYRMMLYLLTGELKRFVDELYRLDDFSYSNIPQHYEEAILIYEYTSGQKVDLHGRQISSQTRLAFAEFRARWGSGSHRDREVIVERFSDTYFSYYFGLSGAIPG